VEDEHGKKEKRISPRRTGCVQTGICAEAFKRRAILNFKTVVELQRNEESKEGQMLGCIVLTARISYKNAQLS
jgi:hypothetical protein